MNANDDGSPARRGPAGPSGSDPGESPPATEPPPPLPFPAVVAAPASGPATDLGPASDPGPASGAGPAPEAGPGGDPDPDRATAPGPETGPITGPGTAPGPETGPISAPGTAPGTAVAGVVTGGSVGGPRTGVAALSLRYRLGAALALAVVAIGVCVHLGMTFLHVAPANTVSKEHGEAIQQWIYPEFEQNWKLFAPNPLQQNISLQARADIRTADGGVRTTRWYDLSAEDGRAIDGNLLPSHTQQNELRRAWDFFVATHDDENRPVGGRGALSESYLRRIVVMRLDRADAAGRGDVVDRVQVRSRTTNVPPPEWSDEQVSTTPVDRTLPWWPVPDDEARGGIG
ncbi:hypothetical protein G3I20_19810 [Streptomyces sp. SID8111]|uniref:DUF5819 family protein n=1 Tax=Streptomyces sp. SID8111 TaxID=2706100 RepID=UPI0013C13B7A|nr:DUF5819 family protein [Streptomyces sp. SID8111]NEC28761.1 hypothetical protein [Streptomyces sp. SID8111]